MDADRARELLAENRERLDSLASALLEHETLDEDDAYAAAGVVPASAGAGDPFVVVARSAGAPPS